MKIFEEQLSERNKEIIRLYEQEKKNFSEIGRIHNLTGQRVRQIVHRYEYRKQKRESVKNMPIMSQLPIPMINMLKRANICSDDDLLEYWEEYGTFYRIRGCGKERCQELEKIIKKSCGGLK